MRSAVPPEIEAVAMRAVSVARWRRGIFPSPLFTGRGTEWGGLRFRKPSTLSRALREPHPPPLPEELGGESRKPAKLIVVIRSEEGAALPMRGGDPEKPDALCLSEAAEATGDRAADLPLPPRGNGATKLQATPGDRTTRRAGVI